MANEQLPPEVVQAFKERFAASPYNKKLGAEGVLFERGRAAFKLAYAEDNTTIMNIVHGGAILSLVDIAATAAAWTTVDNPFEYRGITVNLTLSFIAAGRSQALTAEASIIRQGRSLTYLESTVTNEDGDVIAKALITYKLSKIS